MHTESSSRKPLVRRRRRWQDNIKMGLTGIRCDNVD
jgi:hypothetical protein